MVKDYIKNCKNCMFDKKSCYAHFKVREEVYDFVRNAMERKNAFC